MAQTWLVDERKLRIAKRADGVFRPLLPLLQSFFPPHGVPSGEPQRILVSELWHIGDVIIAVPFLAALRRRFPGATITLLAKSHAVATLANTDFVDEVVTFDFPWTFLDEDRRPGASDVLKLPSLIRRLRRSRFDLAFDCSRDGRNHLLLFLSGAARRVAFAFGGGDYLLTDAIAVGSLDMHRTQDWMRLLEPFGTDVPPGEPRLAVAEAELHWAREFLLNAGHRGDRPLIAVHPGGSSPLKRWAVDHFGGLARIAADEAGARILWIVDPAGAGSGALLPPGSIVARPSLRQLMALLSQCNLLVSNDGGPMHLAAALGVPTFAVYSWGKPEWWKPYSSARHTWVQRADLTCRPCAGHCVFSEPICLTGLSFEFAADEFRREIATLFSGGLAELSARAG